MKNISNLNRLYKIMLNSDDKVRNLLINQLHHTIYDLTLNKEQIDEDDKGITIYLKALHMYDKEPYNMYLNLICKYIENLDNIDVGYKVKRKITKQQLYQAVNRLDSEQYNDLNDLLNIYNPNDKEDWNMIVTLLNLIDEKNVFNINFNSLNRLIEIIIEMYKPLLEREEE